MNIANEIIDGRIKTLERSIEGKLENIIYHEKEIKANRIEIENTQNFVKQLKQIQVDVLQAELN